MTTVTTATPTTPAAKNGDLPNIKPLKVNGEHTPTTEETPKTGKLPNGKHHEVETPIEKKTSDEAKPLEENGEEEEDEGTTNGDEEPEKPKVNGKHHTASPTTTEDVPTEA